MCESSESSESEELQVKEERPRRLTTWKKNKDHYRQMEKLKREKVVPQKKKPVKRRVEKEVVEVESSMEKVEDEVLKVSLNEKTTEPKQEVIESLPKQSTLTKLPILEVTLPNESLEEVPKPKQLPI